MGKQSIDTRESTCEGGTGMLSSNAAGSTAASCPQLPSNVPQIVVPPAASQHVGRPLVANASPSRVRAESPAQQATGVQKSHPPAFSTSTPKLSSRVTWTPVSSPQQPKRVVGGRPSLSPVPMRFTTGPHTGREPFAAAQRIVAAPMRYVQYSVIPGVP